MNCPLCRFDGGEFVGLPQDAVCAACVDAGEEIIEAEEEA